MTGTMSYEDVRELEDQLLYQPETFSKPQRRKCGAAAGLLTVEQAAQLLGMSAKWLYRNYESVPHVLIPAGKKPRIRFRKEALQQWIERHEIDFRKGREQ
jgi:predicted DNA-binding transcriptional regulator AlpA